MRGFGLAMPLPFAHVFGDVDRSTPAGPHLSPPATEPKTPALRPRPACGSRRSKRVLIIDLDPQGNASTGLGMDRKSRVTSSYDMLVGERALRDVIIPTAVPRLFIAPSTMDLLGVELEISGHDDRSYKLRNALRAVQAH